MFRSIWIPDWLYNWLPWAAVLYGALGLLLCDGCLPLAVLAVLVFAYGCGVIAIRASYWSEDWGYE